VERPEFFTCNQIELFTSTGEVVDPKGTIGRCLQSINLTLAPFFRISRPKRSYMCFIYEFTLKTKNLVMTEVTHLEKTLADQKKTQGAITQNLESSINKRFTQLEQHLKTRLKKIEGKLPHSKLQNLHIRYKMTHKI
jgi:hypothetical protein